MKKIALSALSTCFALTACSGGGGGTPDNGNGGNNGGNNGNSALITKLAACPVVYMSSDPAASTCLTGTYEGKDTSGAAWRGVQPHSGGWRQLYLYQLETELQLYAA